jgi:hypothetical protein
MATRGYRTIKLDLPRTKGKADVYTSARVADALREITKDATLYEGVRLAQVMEAVYLQGRKDGARAAFDEVDRSVAMMKAGIPHKKPGRPRKSARRR